MEWTSPTKPFDHAERTLITAILEGQFPPGSALPGERDLAAQLGITRPTLREALRRLERDGWITIQHGKPTLVNDFWRDGGLTVLNGIVRYSKQLPDNFVINLLRVRLDMAPTYTRLAVECDPDAVIALLDQHESLDDTPEAYAAFDWKMHRLLTTASGNPIYALILNGFKDFYEELARVYFALPEARQASRAYYRVMREAAQRRDGDQAENSTRFIMQASILLWEKSSKEQTK